MSPEDIEQIITLLAERLGPTAEVAYRLAIRQTYTYAGIDLFLGAVALLVALRIYRWHPAEDFEAEKLLGKWIAVVVLGAVVVFEFVCAVNRIVNPELTGIMDLFNYMK